MTKEEFYTIAKAYRDFYKEIDRWDEFGINLYTSKFETNFWIVFKVLVGNDFDYSKLEEGTIEDAWESYKKVLENKTV